VTALLGALSALVALLPFAACARVGRALGWFAGSVLRIRRRAVEAAMLRAGVEGAPACARAMYARLGAGLTELLWLSGARPSRRAHAVLESVELAPELVSALEAAVARGPVVLAASHTANWELVAARARVFLAQHGRDLAVVAKPVSQPPVHAFCTQLRTTFGLQVIAPNGAAASARAVLARGGAVAMMIDQVPDRARHGTTVPFLGAPALCDRAPFALARAAGASVLVVGARRRGAVSAVSLLAAWDEPPAPAEGAVVATRALDAFVRSSPADWLWLHRRWRAPRDRRSPRQVPAAASEGPLVATTHPG